MLSQKSLIEQHAAQAALPVAIRGHEQAFMELGSRQQWNFRILGVAPVPERAVFHNQWWLVPLQEDTSAIPARSLLRVRAIYEAGLSPKAFVIAHEAPRQIAPPPGTLLVSPFAYWTKRAADSSVSVAKCVGTALGALVPAVLTILGTGLLAGLALGALVVDPCLIAVTEDDVWIQIDYWKA